IIARLSAGKSYNEINASTGISPATISRIHTKHCPDIPQCAPGHPPKLKEANVHHAVHLITSQKAENAVEVHNALQDI
ncbi:hypothetical protein CPB86DRAFT_673098, partial [Serendipita vermifera]